MNAVIKNPLTTATNLHISGITRDRRSLRLMNREAQLVALIPIDQEAPHGVETAAVTASLLAAAPKLVGVSEAILRWQERQEKGQGLPRSLERKLITALAVKSGEA